MAKRVPLLLVLIVHGIATILLVVKIVGDASAANDLLSFLTPEARAAVMSSTALIVTLILTYALSAWLLLRDYGHGNEAVRKVDEFRALAKEANDRAWNFQPEFLAFKEEFTTKLAGILITHGTALSKFDALTAKVEELANAIEALRREREQSVGEVISGNRTHIAEAANEARGQIMEQLSQRRDHFEAQVFEWKNQLRDAVVPEIQGMRKELNKLHEKVHALERK